jgi:polyhydroxyalkanoate synthesis repressor PhaR
LEFQITSEDTFWWEKIIMPVIKRYPNRKLYDTQAKQYITLDGISELIRDNQEVQVIDNVTGEDITALTLSQIIWEQEKKQGGFLPRSVLAGIIQASGNRLNALQRNLLASKGFIHEVDEEIKRRINYLVQQGELLESEGHKLIEKLLSQNQDNERTQVIIDQQIESILSERNIPTREEISQLSQQLEALAEKLDDMKKN